MGLELFGNIDDLNELFPLGTDPKSEGDDHIRGVKESLKGNVSGDSAVTRLLVAAAAEVIASTALLRLIRQDPGAYLLQGEDSAGVNGVIEFDPATGVNMLSPAGVKVLTDIVAELRVLNPVGNVGLELRLETSGKASMVEIDGAGAVVQTWQTFDPAAGTNLLFNDEVRLSTVVDGAEIKSFVDEAMSLTLLNAVGGWLIVDQTITGQLIFIQVSSAGAIEANAIICNRGGDINFFHNNSFALDTADVAVNNTGANVRSDGNGTKPVGFNVLPRLDMITGRTLVPSDSGMMIRTTAAVTISVPLVGVPEDFTCVILNAATGPVTVQATGGAIIRLYTGSAFADGTVFLAVGSVATLSRAGTSTVFEIWGNGASQ